MCSEGTCDDCMRSNRVLQGLPGLPGLNGKTVLSGTGVPDPSLGVDGDFYIDLNAPMNIYLKVAGVWVFKNRLMGVDGNGFLYTESTLISSAQLLNSLASPVVVTQTPPAGYAIVPVSIVGSLRYNSVPYVCQYGMGVVYNNPSNTFVAAWASFLVTNTVSTMSNAPVSPQLNIPTGVPLAVRPNYPGNITAGNSELLVRVIYYITPA